MRCPTLSELPPPPSDKTGWPWTEESPQLPDTMPDGSPWPRISIVTPSFNQGQFIEETIRSVLLQGYPNLEYIIIDGGSTDNSVDIIKKYEPWLAYWVSEKDRGQSHAINKGFERCEGDFITFQNSDDYYLKSVFGDVAIRWRQFQQVGAIIGSFYYSDKYKMQDTFIVPYLPNEGPIDLVLTSPNRWRLHQVSTFFTKNALDSVGRFVREDLNYTMDRELLYRVCRNYKVLLTDIPYGVFRWHLNGKSRSNFLAADLEYAELHLSYSYQNKIDNKKKAQIANQIRAYGYIRYVKNNNSYFPSIKALLKAVQYNPQYLIRVDYWIMWLNLMNFPQVKN